MSLPSVLTRRPVLIMHGPNMLLDKLKITRIETRAHVVDIPLLTVYRPRFNQRFLQCDTSPTIILSQAGSWGTQNSANVPAATRLDYWNLLLCGTKCITGVPSVKAHYYCKADMKNCQLQWFSSDLHLFHSVSLGPFLLTKPVFYEITVLNFCNHMLY